MKTFLSYIVVITILIAIVLLFITYPWLFGILFILMLVR